MVSNIVLYSMLKEDFHDTYCHCEYLTHCIESYNGSRSQLWYLFNTPAIIRINLGFAHFTSHTLVFFSVVECVNLKSSQFYIHFICISDAERLR